MITHIRWLTLLLALVISSIFAAEIDPRITAFFKKYPEADVNKDGTLTLEEARQYKSRMRKKKTRPPSSQQKRYTAEELARSYQPKEFNGLQYRFFTPKTTQNTKYPLVLSLHGAGGKGTDNLKNLKTWNGTLIEPAFQQRHPCYIVAPQSNQPWRVPGSVPDINADDRSTWSELWQKMAEQRPQFVSKTPNGKLGLVFDLLDHIGQQYPIDLDRVYVLGHSMGGFGTFEALAMQPDRFAAAIPSAGGLSAWLDPATFKDVPVWAFHGDKDTTVPIGLVEEIFDQLKAAGGNMKLTTLGGVGHGSAEFAFSYLGDSMNPNFVTNCSGPLCDKTENSLDWLFAQKRR